MLKVIVTHHPFDLPEGYDNRDLLGRARMAITGLSDCGADVFLAGHLHVAHTRHTAIRYPIRGYAALIVQAGTAISTRERGEPNSFNVLRTRGSMIDVERYEWTPDAASFTLAATEHFHHTADGWERIREQQSTESPAN
jgi:3',5'-cyclic AMP phosphodiesterase CpdA